MFDFGWQELMLVAFVLVLVVGPKDLPRALKTFTTYMGKIRGMANDFRSSLMEVADQEEFKEVKKAIADTKTGLIEQTKEPMADIRKNMEEAGKAAEITETVDNIKDTASQLKAETQTASASSASASEKKPAEKNTNAKKPPAPKASTKPASAKSKTPSSS
jgi:sec-independent protein translocase protein TatB